MIDEEPVVENPVGMWYGFLSLFLGLIGAMLVIQGVAGKAMKDFSFAMGILTFIAAFFLKILHMVYSERIYE